MNHLMRTTPCSIMSQYVAAFDHRIVDAVRETSHSDASESYIHARNDYGGNSYRRLEYVCPAANLASLVLCLPTMCTLFPEMQTYKDHCDGLHLDDDCDVISADQAREMSAEAATAGNFIFVWLCEAWIELRLQEVRDSIPPDPRLCLTGYYERKDTHKIQRSITRELDDIDGKSLKQQTESLGPAQTARNLSNSNSGSAAWTRVIPIKQSLRMSPHEYRTAHCIREGKQPYLPLRCTCGSSLVLAHALSCKHLRGRFRRHDSLVEDLFRWLRARKVLVQKELLVLPNSSARIDLWVRLGDKLFWLDVRISDPSNPSYLPGSAQRAGYAIQEAERDKIDLWQARLRDAEIPDVTVVPMVFETSGRIGEKMQSFIQLISRETQHNGGPGVYHLWDQLSVTMQKMNVGMIDEAVRKATGVKARRAFCRG
jgi:hypothetical protein